MKRTAIPFIAALFLIMIATLASADMLEFSDVVVEVDNDKQSANEAGGSIDIIPDSTLDLKIEVTNLFDSDAEDAEIEDIEIEVILEEVDDGDDLEETSDDFDLRAGRDKTVSMSFDIPLKLETDASYIMTLDAEGEDQNGTIHKVHLEFDVDVDKEKHELRFIRHEVNPATVTCNRNTRLELDIINTGEEDEDVELIIDAAALNYNKRMEFEMYEDIDDDENEYSFSDTLDLEGIRPGSYPIYIKALYYDSKRTLEDTITVEVGECALDVEEEEEEPEPEPEPKPEPKEEETVVEVVSQPTVVPTSSASAQVRQAAAVATPRTTYTQNSFWDENKWLMVILLTDLMLIGAGAAVVVYILKRRK